MGVWFLGASVGNFLGGQAASFYESMPLARLLAPSRCSPMVAGVMMLLFPKRYASCRSRVTYDGSRRIPPEA